MCVTLTWNGCHRGGIVWILMVSTGLLFGTHAARPDILTLKDGSTLPCEVITEWKDPDSGKEYLQIRANNSLVLILRQAVDHVEKKPLPENGFTENVEQVLEKLIREGTIVSDSLQSKDSTSPAARGAAEFQVTVKEIRGWAYLYENPYSTQDRKRSVLAPGDTLPLGRHLVVSPNSRITLAMGKAGEIGLESRTELRLDEARVDHTTYGYRVNLRLLNGSIWVKIDTSSSSGRNMILIINAVRTVVKQTTLYAQSAEKTGSVDITLVESPNRLSFWRSIGDPFSLAVGEVLKVSPNTNKPDIQPVPALDAVKANLRDWSAWKPEPLAFEFSRILPPFEIFPPFSLFPALHPQEITIDQTMLLPPETRSLGMILDAYKKALEQYKSDVGRYPSNEHGLEALVKDFRMAGWKGPYIPMDMPRRDLWGSPFVYEVIPQKDKTFVDVPSMGPNRKDDKGLEDDIR